MKSLSTTIFIMLIKVAFGQGINDENLTILKFEESIGCPTCPQGKQFDHTLDDIKLADSLFYIVINYYNFHAPKPLKIENYK